MHDPTRFSGIGWFESPRAGVLNDLTAEQFLAAAPIVGHGGEIAATEVAAVAAIKVIITLVERICYPQRQQRC